MQASNPQLFSDNSYTTFSGYIEAVPPISLLKKRKKKRNTFYEMWMPMLSAFLLGMLLMGFLLWSAASKPLKIQYPVLTIVIPTPEPTITPIPTPFEFPTIVPTIENRAPISRHMSPIIERKKQTQTISLLREKTSEQYKLQQLAVTDELGFRKYQGRYMIAMGTGWVSHIGQYVDAWYNGILHECVVGDVKRNEDTDPTNKHGLTNNSTIEFIIDRKNMNPVAVTSGDMSYFIKGDITQIVVYERRP